MCQVYVVDINIEAEEEEKGVLSWICFLACLITFVHYFVVSKQQILLWPLSLSAQPLDMSGVLMS